MLTHTWTIILVLLSTMVFAQRIPDQKPIPNFEFKVREETRQMERATANAFVLSYPVTDLKMVGNAWKKYAKGLGGKVSYDRRINEYFVDNGEVADLSENKVDITAKLYEADERTEIAIWFNMGVTYLQSSEYPERYQAAEKLLRDFDAFIYAELLRSQIKVEEKALRLIGKDVRKIERNRKKEEKAIERAQRTIEKAQKAMDQSKQEIVEYDQALDEKKAEENQQTERIKQMKTKIKSIR